MKKRFPMLTLFSLLAGLPTGIGYASCPDLSGLYEVKVLEEKECNIHARYKITQKGCEEVTVSSEGESIVGSDRHMGLNHFVYGQEYSILPNGNREYSQSYDLPRWINNLIAIERHYHMKTHWERNAQEQVTGLVMGSYTVINKIFNAPKNYETYYSLDLQQYSTENKITLHGIYMLPKTRVMPQDGVVRCEAKLLLVKLP